MGETPCGNRLRKRRRSSSCERLFSSPTPTLGTGTSCAMRTGPSPQWKRWTRNSSAAGTRRWGRGYRLPSGGFFRPGEEEDRAILSQLAGEKVLVLGNHDRHRAPAQWRSLGFEEAVPWPPGVGGGFLPALSRAAVYQPEHALRQRVPAMSTATLPTGRERPQRVRVRRAHQGLPPLL